MMSLVYENISSKVDPSDRLDQEVDKMHGDQNKHLMAIARHLSSLEGLALALGLDKDDLKTIQSMHPDSMEKQT